MEKCGTCKGTGSVNKYFGGSASPGSEDSTTCNVCNGSGMVRGSGPDGGGVPKSRLPIPVVMGALAVGFAAGYLSYQEGSFPSDYDRMMTAGLVGVFAYLAVVIVYRIVTNPVRAIVMIAAVWAIDFFILGRTIETFLRGLVAG